MLALLALTLATPAPAAELAATLYVATPVDDDGRIRTTEGDLDAWELMELVPGADLVELAGGGAAVRLAPAALLADHDTWTLALPANALVDAVGGPALVAVGVTNDHHGVDTVAIGITNDHHGVDTVAIGITNDHLGIDDVAIGITNDHLGAEELATLPCDSGAVVLSDGGLVVLTGRVR